MTNIEYIRNMDIEELAVLLTEEKEYGVAHEVYYMCPDGEEFDGNKYNEALQHTIEWLKQPREDGEEVKTDA